MKILHVDSGITGPASVSRTLSGAIVERERRRHPEAKVITRDLAASPIAHLGPAHALAIQGTVPEDPAVQADIAGGKAALDEFLAADVIVIGAPMYNFGVPSQLKAWIDRLAVPGATFRYTETGPQGLVAGKRVVIASSRGGFYGPGTPTEAFDHQESYLRAIFGFFGITDITVVRAEGVAMGPEARDGAIAKAREEIDALAA